MNRKWKIIVQVLLIVMVIGVGVYIYIRADEQFGRKLPVPVTQTEKIKFPVVAYKRLGLLNSSESGRMEIQNLEEKLINPYSDYYNGNEVALVALYIEIPQNVGEGYIVTGIFCGGRGMVCGGTEQFVFGQREQEYDYWRPSCMGPCEFSDAFKKKYPQIAE